MEWNTCGIFRMEWNGIFEKGEILRKFPENGNRLIFRNTEVMSDKKQNNCYFFHTRSTF